MGMPITIQVTESAKQTDLEAIFSYFESIDKRYSPYKEDSELSRINHGLSIDEASSEMRYVLGLCEQTKTATNGYFDILNGSSIDTSGLVKGWAIQNAANQLKLAGFNNFFIEAGGDVAVSGHNDTDAAWQLGIRNPFNAQEIVKVLAVTNCGVATSGTYIRGGHIYDPLRNYKQPRGVQSLTIVGPNIYEADRYATAAFAMGTSGVSFIEQLEGFEAYMIDDQKIATYTSGFKKYVAAAY
jgi:thiamine biosynthesis lipoprotein